jgi:putative SOS response-associated peptidase YedK
MTPRDGGVLAFAGLWTTWGAAADRLMTCSIVTTAAVGELAAVHDRMPLVLPTARWAAWLAGPAAPDSLLAPPPGELLAQIEIRPVGPAVGDVRNDGPGLIERADAEPPRAPDAEPPRAPDAEPPRAPDAERLRPPADEPVDLTLF